MSREVIIVIGVLIISGFTLGAPDCSKTIDPATVLSECCEKPKWEGENVINTKNCHTSTLSCAAECMMNETQVLVDGKVDMAKMRALVDKVKTTNAEFKPIVLNAFEICGAKLQRTTMEEKTSNDECNPYAMLLIDCVDTHTLANCPASNWDSTPECNEAKDYVNLCL